MMTRSWRILLGLLLVALMIEIVIVAPHHLGTPEDRPIQNPTLPTDQKAELVIDGAHYLEWEIQGDAKEWELWAKRAIRVRNEKIYRIEGVKVQFMNRNQVAYDVTGDQGEVLEETKDVVIKGHVVTRSSNGYRFETEVLNYNSDKKTLLSPSQVRMTGPADEEGSRLTLTGRDLLADMNSSLIRIGSNVKARKTVKSGRKLTVSAKGAELSGSTHVAKFIGQVVMDVDSVRITGPEAEFKYRPGSSSAIESVIVRGGARLSDVDKWATAREVQYDVLQNRFVFDGSPRVFQNGDELIGDKIIFYNGGEQIEVFKAKAQVDKRRMETP